jgi:hypothetical protein
MISTRYDADFTLDYAPDFSQKPSSSQNMAGPRGTLIDFGVVSLATPKGFQSFFQCSSLTQAEGVILPGGLELKILNGPLLKDFASDGAYERRKKEALILSNGTDLKFRHKDPVTIYLVVKPPLNVAVRLRSVAKRHLIDRLGQICVSRYATVSDDCLIKPNDAPPSIEGGRIFFPSPNPENRRITLLFMNVPIMI